MTLRKHIDVLTGIALEAVAGGLAGAIAEPVPGIIAVVVEPNIDLAVKEVGAVAHVLGKHSKLTDEQAIKMPIMQRGGIYSPESSS